MIFQFSMNLPFSIIRLFFLLTKLKMNLLIQIFLYYNKLGVSDKLFSFFQSFFIGYKKCREKEKRKNKSGSFLKKFPSRILPSLSKKRVFSCFRFFFTSFKESTFMNLFFTYLVLCGVAFALVSGLYLAFKTIKLI